MNRQAAKAAKTGRVKVKATISRPCHDLIRQCANTAKNGIDAAFGHLKRSKTWFQANFFGVASGPEAIFGGLA